MYWIWIFLLCEVSVCVGLRVVGKNQSVSVGDDAHLYCALADAASEELTRVVWRKSTREQPGIANFISITQERIEHLNGLKDRVTFTGSIEKNNGSILLKDVKFSDDGRYTCVCNVFPSGTYQTTMNLTVLVPPAVNVSTDITPVVGDTERTLASCTASAYPAAEVSWHLGTLKESLRQENHFLNDSFGTVTVTSNLIGVPSKELNQQTFQCVVKHVSLKEELILAHTLVIHYPPQVVYITSAGGKKRAGEFECLSDANPRPTYFIWSRRFPLEKQTLPSNGSRLFIKSTSANNGLYYCIASNQYGSGVGSLTVHVDVDDHCSITCWILFSLVIVAAVSAFILKFNILKNCRDFLWNLCRSNPDSDSGQQDSAQQQNPQEQELMSGRPGSDSGGSNRTLE